MSSVTTVAVAGGLIGGGLWHAWSGWSPSRPPLAQALERLGRPEPMAAPREGRGLDRRVGLWAKHLGIVQRTLESLRSELRILRRSPEEQAAMFVTATVLGFLVGPFVATAAAIVGLGFSLAVPVWFAAAGGGIGAVLEIRSVRSAAAQRRQDFARAVAAFCEVAGMCLAAGRSVETALGQAADAGSGWTFEELQGALEAGYLRGSTPWAALDRLGEELAVADLRELAAAMSLAGDEGATVRETLASKARTIRERLTADAERAAANATELMSVPSVFLVLGFVAFLAFPAIWLLFQQ